MAISQKTNGMPYPEFDRFAVKMEPLSARQNKQQIENDHVSPDTEPPSLSEAASETVQELVQRVRKAQDNHRPVMVAFGAHTIKNGLGPVLLRLVERGWVTHLATNGAGVIHDWEFAYQGKSSEHVGPLVEAGRFGHWQETGFSINLALNVGAFEGLGYGESIGALIENEGLQIPSAEDLEKIAVKELKHHADQAAAAADLLWVVRRFQLEPGWMSIPHQWKKYSVQAGAFRNRVPLTGHPMIGHDIIYNHPMNRGACLGRAAERDYLIYAENVSRMEGGVYISIGSAVMSPMIFEKSFSMAQNIAIQRGKHIDNHYIFVNDLAECSWDWSQGEPPEKNPAYYLRYNKTFSRMQGTLRYLQADNRDFLLNLTHRLENHFDK
jgi:hypothetical protein